MAGQFQSDAYRLAAPPPGVMIAMPPPAPMTQQSGALKIEGQEKFGRLAAGGRS
jgi:hypothetical protein